MDNDAGGDRDLRAVAFPNTIKRRRTSLDRSDTMVEQDNGHAIAPHTPGAKSNYSADGSILGDVDTCRICRGEGTPTEPLFYPCKCSGSIKYVHQDCLMEWLSHSQKKHCELCKTPFRFTKLYSPNMPKRLPAHVFVSHMAKYLFRNIVIWLRAVLVAAVWLVCLPYLMRSAWSWLFWISDEGFGPAAHSTSFVNRNLAPTSPGAISLSGCSAKGTTTCPSSPLWATPSPSTTSKDLANLLLQALNGLNQPLNFTSISLQRLLPGSGNMPPSEKAVNLTLNSSLAADIKFNSMRSSDHPSLLSNVRFLQDLTRYTSTNKAIIHVLEGQIITVVVIVCFILIILVRDYVVQQQPEINMRAAFAAQDNNVDAAPAIGPGPAFAAAP
jgi:E3 ubiquitin-protein ligase MARCH6